MSDFDVLQYLELGTLGVEVSLLELVAPLVVPFVVQSFLHSVFSLLESSNTLSVVHDTFVRLHTVLQSVLVVVFFLRWRS